jgi:short-subunit dehydrogenase
MNVPERFRGRAAMVTGASSGIGRALALRLAQGGMRIALVARRREALDALAAEIAAQGGEACALPCDVEDAAAVVETARAAVARFGAIDLLVNNAGYGHHRPFLRWDLDDMERMMRVNYLGSLRFTKALLPGMVERGGGSLVFVASVAGKIGLPDESAYAASKFALIGLAQSLSLEVEDAGVDVLVVCPGAIRTAFFDAEALARMPAVAKRSMADVAGLVDAVIDAIARRKRELTYPRSISAAYVVQALAPGFMRRQVKRTTIGANGGVASAEPIPSR